MIKTLSIETPGRSLRDVTTEVRAVVAESKVKTGICSLFIRHTSASLVIQENADPAVLRDLERWLAALAPESAKAYEHDAEGPAETGRDEGTSRTRGISRAPRREAQAGSQARPQTARARAPESPEAGGRARRRPIRGQAANGRTGREARAHQIGAHETRTGEGRRPQGGASEAREREAGAFSDDALRSPGGLRAGALCVLRCADHPVLEPPSTRNVTRHPHRLFCG